MASKALHHTKQSLSSNPSFSPLLTSITKTLQSLKPTSKMVTNIPQIIPPLSPFSPHLNPTLVIQVINNQTSPYQSLLFFNWAANPSPNPSKYFHTFQCYIAMVDLLLSHRLFSLTTHFLESHNLVCDFMIAKFIKAFGNGGEIRAAIWWFNRARKLGNCLSSCNTLLSVLVRSNRMKLACAIFDNVIKDGLIELDIITYTTMIKGYCKVGNVENARKVFDEMPCEPNMVTYGTLVNGYCKKGMMVEARQIVDKMIMSGSCLPDLVTYSALIDGYCKKGEMETAMLCLNEMVMQGFEPNLITYNVIVNGFCLIGNVEEAKKMMTRMRLNGVKDDVVTHTSLLKGFCVSRRVDEGVEHLKYMISIGMKPDVQAYGVLVNEFCKLGKANEAIALLRDMITRGLNPSISSYNLVLKVLVERGELNEAIHFLKWMPKVGVTPNFLSYFSVISGLSKTGRRIEQVEELVDCMLRDGHKLDFSLYNCLAMMYSKNGELEKAAEVIFDALRNGLMVNLECFEVFMEGLCAKGKISDAEEIAQMLLGSCQVTGLHDYQKVLSELKCKYSHQEP